MKKTSIIVAILLMVIGFAAVSTTLFINGQVNVGANIKNFDIYFSEAIVEGEDVSNEVIDSTKKRITYETKTLSLKDETSVLDFEVTNNSTQYDADVTINCTIDQNSTYKNLVTVTTDQPSYVIPAQTRKNGSVTVTLKDTYVETTPAQVTFECELVATAVERNDQVDVVIKDKIYQITGTLTDNEGNILANQKVVVYSDSPHYITTDDYGFLYVNGLEKGSHEIYIVNENAEEKTKEEIQTTAIDKSNFTTGSKSIGFNKVQLNNLEIKEEELEEIYLDLDANGGIITDNSIKINKFAKANELPIPSRATNYKFDGWYAGDKKITSNTIITSNMKITAKWINLCEYEVGKVWNYNYTGSEQNFAAPCDGIYKFELWGGSVPSYSNQAVFGGYYPGAYASGDIELSKNNKFYVYVGEAGRWKPSKSSYNGGGIGYIGGYYKNYPNQFLQHYSGAGATDIRIVNGTWSATDSLRSRIMVAGGAAYVSPGGGLKSNDTSSTVSKSKNTGATQTTYGKNNYSSSYNGTFGIGGKGENYGQYYGSAGGGGGYYGGAGSLDNAWNDDSSNYHNRAARPTSGSSFISGHEGCDAINSSGTHTGQPIHYSGYKFINTKMIDGYGYEWTTIKGELIGLPEEDAVEIRAGNGYARITLVSLD